MLRNQVCLFVEELERSNNKKKKKYHLEFFPVIIPPCIVLPLLSVVYKYIIFVSIYKKSNQKVNDQPTAYTRIALYN